MIEISKELLIKALGNRWIDATSGRTVEEKFTLTPTGNYILFGYKGYNHWNDSINIYELAHKCKEWAIKQHKIDLITLELDKNEKTISCSILYGEIHPNMKMYYFNADTEVEAIFKACEWILRRIKEGN